MITGTGMIARLCRSCSDVFHVSKPSNKKMFCSMSCAARHNNKGRLRSAESRLKSHHARLAYMAENGTGTNHRPRTFPELTNIKRASCSWCGEPFWSRRRRRHDQNYSSICSDQCYIAVKAANATGIKRVMYKGVKLDSGWELRLAEQLDASGIEWERPQESILWIDSKSRRRRYYADFFLPQLNLYLDPKNPLVISRQQEKIDKVRVLVDLIYGHPDDIMMIVLEKWRSRQDSNLQRLSPPAS